MANPKELYYSESGSRVRYTSKPTNRINFKRAMAGRSDCFVSGISSRNQKQKKLILADWSARNWDDEKKTLAIERLKSLMAEGFSIYLWQSGEVKPLTDLSCLDDINSILKITPEFPEKIIKAAVTQQNLTKANAFILDKDWFEWLLHCDSTSKPGPQRKLKISDLLNLEENQVKLLLDIFKKTNLSIDTLIYDVLSTTTIIEPPILKINYQNTEAAYESIIFDGLEVTAAVSQNPKQYLQPCLKKLTVRSKDDVTELLSLLDTDILSGIESLNLSRSKRVAGFFSSLKKGSLGKLKSVNLYDTDITSDDVAALLAAAPNLEILNLTSCKQIAGSFSSLEKGSLGKLKSVNLKATKITPSDLVAFRAAAPNLQNINLCKCKQLAGSLSSLEKGSLNTLKTIDLSSGKFTSDDRSALLNAAPNLESINLLENGNMAGAYSLKKGSLSKLKTVKLNYSDGLSTLLSAAPNLESIELCECDQLARVLSSLEKGSLGKLKKFSLFRSNITAKELLVLSTIAPNLETLEFIDCEHLAGVMSSLEKGSLSKLKNISFANGNITTNDISTLRLAAPNLESIEISDCTQIAGVFSSLKEGSLSKLKRLNLDICNITSADLSALCSAAPNIKMISLFKCEQIAGGFSSLEKGSLSKLKRLNLANCNITSADLSALCSAAPNLEMIYLFKCKQIAGGFSSLEKGSLSKLKEAYLMGSILTPEDLNALSAAAVNLNIPGATQPADRESTNSSQKLGTNTKPTTANLDADTKDDPNKILTAKRIFCSTEGEPLPVNTYRLSLFNKLEVNKNPCSLDAAFEMSLVGKLDLIPCDATRSLEDVFELGKTIKQTDEYSYAYGLQTFKLDEEWQAIPSLNASEELLHYHTNPSTAEIEIQYSKHHNRYCIRSVGQKQTISLDFLLKVPTPAITLPDEIQHLVNRFNSFKPGELELDPAKTQFNGEDYLNYILNQKKGACRHRAFAFGHLLQEQEQYHQFPMRVVTNDCHAFVEVMIDNQWINCDLGGYAAKLDIKEMVKPTPLSGTKYDAQLQPWRNEKPPAESLKAYLQTLVQPSEKKNRLVKLDSEKSVTALIGSLQKHCQDTSRPVFYLHSPEEASGLSHYIKRKGNIGTMTKGAGSPLAAFLTADYPADVSPLLIVNYSRFNADDIVRLNTMLDTKRSVEDIKIPDSMILVGVNNTNDPDCYQGSDFYSRFDKKASNPVSKTALAEVITQFPARLSEDAPANTINLFHSSDWKFRLLGGWVLGEGNLVFKEGLLQSALKKDKPLTIENGLWDDPEFVFFWQQACLTGNILGEGGTVFDTRDLKIETLEGYDWGLLKKGWLINPDFKGEELILNPETLSDYFEGYEITADKRAKPSLGFIQNAAEKGQEVLNVYVSHNLSDDNWAMLLSECQNRKIGLSLRCAPGVSLPGEPPNDFQPQVFGWKPSIQEHTQFIQSSDIDTTVAMLTKAKQWEVIDISECSPSNLLLETRPEFKEDHFEFTKTERALLVALKAGKSVILKGNFSEELSCALTSLLLSRLKEKEIKGELILVSNSKENFEYLPNLYAHEVRVEEKQALVKTENPLIDWPKPLSTIKAELQFPGSSKGLLTLENSIHPLPAFDAEKSAKETEEFNQQRKDLIWNVLTTSPYVYIAGLTGVGKSTFIKSEFLKGIPHKLYRGEQDMDEWAREKSDELKVIFIDEANLSAKQWSEFEGLFNIKPTISINGELITLTPQHKVIFAGNPLSYGDERELAPFFTRHQRVVIFDPLPLAVIYEQILKPVFSNKSYASQAPEISKPMLDVYAFLHGLSTEDVLISPRELQMMALLTASYCEKIPEANSNEVAKHYAYQLAKDLVPASEKAAFDRQFKLQPLKPLPLPEPAKDSNFKITQSRLPAANCLNELLELRQVRRAIAVNDQQKYGGLGGVIFEGEPGVGKSELVTAMLRAHGYKKIKSDAPMPEKGFYRMKASLSLAEKEDLLIKAFYAGDVVVIDEINSSPMMESLLNDLLNGQEPTSNSPEKPKDPSIKPKPGFMVIGTQNPRTMAGRREISSPLLKRVQSLEIPPYPPLEMMEILQKDLPATATNLKQELNDLVDSYTRNLALAEKEQYNPPPTFRDVMRLAKRIKDHLPKEEVNAKKPPTKAAQPKSVIPPFNPRPLDPRPLLRNNSRDPGFFRSNNLKNDSWHYPDAITVCGFSMAIVAGAASLTLISLGPIGLGILGAAIALAIAIALTAVMVTSLLAGFVGLGLIACSDEKEDLLTSPAKIIR